MKYITIVIVGLVFLLQTGCGGSLTQLAENMLYPVDSVNKTAVPDEPPAGLGQVTLEVEAVDGQKMNIHAWYYLAPNSNANTFIYCHGNGVNLGVLAEANFMEAFKTLKANFVVFDYPSYGKSTGTPNEENLVRSAQAVLDFAKGKFSQSGMIVWGRSLGASVATLLTARNQSSVAGMILTSPWNKFYDVAVELTGLAKQLPKEWLEQHAYDSAAAAGGINTVTMIHHGTEDTTIPIKFGRILFNSLPDRGQAVMYELEGRQHNDVYAEASVWEDLRNFVR